VQLQNSAEAGRIYVPLISLTYEELKGEDISNLLDGTTKEVLFEYRVSYNMDMSRSLEDVKVNLVRLIK
jgi:hypothetical protein